jgi:hypothetical protein
LSTIHQCILDANKQGRKKEVFLDPVVQLTTRALQTELLFSQSTVRNGMDPTDSTRSSFGDAARQDATVVAIGKDFGRQ